MKICDQSCPIKKDTVISKEAGHVDYSTLVLFANKFEDLPISQRIGDIIRVHRASYQIWKGQK